ncbi:MAG: hypothetical protein ACI8UO_006375 [Verrucomicrobiales bacterium]|jgi:hypothetical protein
MRLNHGAHLGYCTNIHRGETWAETFDGLDRYTLAVKREISPDAPYGIGLRLSNDAAIELSEPAALEAFQAWLEANNCYVFTINGFPFGKFHGSRVKEQVYVPDWTANERLEYTNLLFDLIAKLAPVGEAGSVSTLPGSFKEFIRPGDDSQVERIIQQLLACDRRIEEIRQQTGRDLHLGLEPEPLGLFETSAETVAFFEKLSAAADDKAQLLRNIGVNYDTCHLAVEFESAGEAIGRIRDAGIRISKLHISSALKTRSVAEATGPLREFADDIYLHQVVARNAAGRIERFRDLPDALEADLDSEEWRIHFHIPLHASPESPFADTRDHIVETFDLLAADPAMCQHMEMETYTWEVLPESMRSTDVVQQLLKEYEWTLGELRQRGF